MSEERWMSEIEVSLLQDRIAAEKPSLQHKEYTEDGYELYTKAGNNQKGSISIERVRKTLP